VNNFFNKLLIKIRNKITIDKTNTLEILPTAKVVACTISIRGKNNKIHIGNNTVIRNSIIEINGTDCEIFIGKDCTIGHDCYFVAKEKNTKIEIGNKCMFSRNINIMASDGHAIFNLDDQRINPSKNIIISHNTWLADNVTILKGIEIGSHSIVGINSTLTKSIPKNSIAAGNPAKIVSNDIYWEK
jgi:acetyltransferase-like isoleucine patch superfamily enzyme